MQTEINQGVEVPAHLTKVQWKVSPTEQCVESRMPRPEDMEHKEKDHLNSQQNMQELGSTMKKPTYEL